MSSTWKNNKTRPHHLCLVSNPSCWWSQFCANDQTFIDCYQQMPCVQAHIWRGTILYWFYLPNSGLVWHKSASARKQDILQYITTYNECGQGPFRWELNFDKAVHDWVVSWHFKSVDTVQKIGNCTYPSERETVWTMYVWVSIQGREYSPFPWIWLKVLLDIRCGGEENY